MKVHCKKCEGIQTFKKGFSAYTPSKEGTQTLELNPAVEGMQPFNKVSIPFTAGLSSRVLVPSVEGMYAENSFLKVLYRYQFPLLKGFHSP
jgi:hypothetical protein